MTRRQYTPRPYAALASRHLADVERCALWAKPGMGKTVITLTHLDILHNVLGESAPSLVLAPLRVARDTWATESEKWHHLRSLDVVPIVGELKERQAALRRDAPVYTVNYEQLPWLVEQYKDRAWPFRTIAADESTKLKSFRLRQGGVRAQALGKIAHTDVKRWINLTGTPASNGLKDLWGQTWFLDAGVRLGRSYDAFESRWFAYRRVKDALSGKATVQPFILPHAHDEIHERLSDICLTLDPKDWFDLHEPIVTTIEVTLSNSAMAKYKEFEKELFLRLANGEEVEAFSAADKTNKCRQLANGAVYTDDAGSWAAVHDEKLDALESLVEETGDEPLLVSYFFVSDRERLLKRFPDALDLSRPDHLAAAKRGVGKLWLAHPRSLGHGVDGLQEYCRSVVFFAQDWNLEEHDQILERVGAMRQFQAGKDEPMFIYYLVAKKTIDELVMARRVTKRSVQDTLMDYMKERRL